MGDVMKYKNLIKSNLKFIIAMTVVIALGAVGITFAINIDTFNPIGINIGTATLGANITVIAIINFKLLFIKFLYFITSPIFNIII
jgi:hypothetical protein